MQLIIICLSEADINLFHLALQIIQRLIERGFGCLQDSVAMVTGAESSSSRLPLAVDNCRSMSDLRLSLYKYCDRFLRLADSPGESLVNSIIIILWCYYCC